MMSDELSAKPAAVSEREAATPRALEVVLALSWRELVRFFRQRNRVIGAVGQPVLFWLLFSTGLNRSFRLSETGELAGQSFGEYFFPGTIAMILLFTAIFSTISIIEDRHEGFLQSVLVAPVPRWAMVGGKILGGTLIALFQAGLFVGLGALLGIRLSAIDYGLLGLIMLISALGMTSLGFVIAWRLDSVQGFHAIMSILLLPMWLMSGAFFPIPAVANSANVLEIGMHWVMKMNPLTYNVAGMRRLFLSEVPAELSLPSTITCWLVSAGFAVVLFSIACAIAGQRTTGDLK